MYRVYNRTKKRWITDVLIHQNGDLVQINKSKFGKEKIKLISDDCVVHNDIGLCDKNNRLIFEGDIVSHYNVTGIVTYVKEQASYVLVDCINKKYYPIYEQVANQCTIIGNVFDNPI